MLAPNSQVGSFDPYLIFVIFFTQAKFLENKIYTEKRQFLPIFRVKSVKIYKGAARGARDKYEVCFNPRFTYPKVEALSPVPNILVF